MNSFDGKANDSTGRSVTTMMSDTSCLDDNDDGCRWNRIGNNIMMSMTMM